MDKEKEIWKDIEGFPGYQVSSIGRVRCFRNFNGIITDNYRILKPILNKDDYYYVDLYTIDRKQVHKRIHRLIADTFLGPQPELVVNHINGDKHDNRVENIEWVTAKQNSTLAAEAGLYKTQAVRVIETGEVFKSVKTCGESLNVHPSNISMTVSGKRSSSGGLHFEYIGEDEYEKSIKQKRKPFLYPHQEETVSKMFNGCVVNGTVGSGKSRTALYYYFSKNGGSIKDHYIPMRHNPKPPDLYILTTAKKRNDKEWEQEMIPFLMSPDPEQNQLYGNKIVIDSWQNIKKYDQVTGSFFIFDENKINGKGAWAKSFLKITKNNEWIILSASNGDRWEDYETLFIAEGFYRNRTEFRQQHLIYSNYAKFPKVEGYRNETRLFRLRERVLIDMDFQRHTVQHHEDVYVNYDIHKYKEVMRKRWNPFTDEPITQASSLCYVLRKIVNEDESRQVALLELLDDHPKAIVFYNFDGELDILLNLVYQPGTVVAQYNGHKHEPIPKSERWVYLVNYNACEAWNSISTDTMIFYSQNYSYKVMIQAAGRIDRLTSPFNDLYYFHLKSRSSIDLTISKALRDKKKFNERKFAGFYK